MTIITTVVNPVDDSEVTLATGMVKRILYKDASAKQKQYDTTHNASVILAAEGEDDVFVNLSLKIKSGQEPQIRYAEGKKGSETWHTLNQGDMVKIQMKDVNKVGDKTYYQTSLSRIKVTKKADVAPQSNAGSSTAQSQQTSFKKRDTTGMETGHAVNGALELKRSGVKGDVVDLAKLVHEATVELKAEVAKERGVDVSDYDTGASVGHAILNACRDAGKSATKESLIEDAKVVLNASEEVSAFIKSGGVVKEEKKAEPEKKVSKPKEEKKEEEPPMNDGSETNFDDFDDDVPFAYLGLQYATHAIHVMY